MFNLGLLAMVGMPGIFELLIIGVVVIVPIVVAVSIVVATSRRNRLPGSSTLAPCPDCNHAVSIRAQTCPHCGAPLKPLA